MTARGTILIGLLLCTALLAVTHFTTAPASSGECPTIEIETNEAGYKSGYHVFGEDEGPHAWFVHEGELVIENGNGMRVAFSRPMIDSFHCILPPP